MENSPRRFYLLPTIAVDKEATHQLRLGFFFGFLPIVVFIIWSLLTPIDGAIIANGALKIDRNSKIIQHFEGGIVRDILVKEGSVVQAGQPLITLENIDIHSKLTILENKLKALRAKESRFFAQQAKQKTINFPPDLVHDSNPKIQHALANELHVFQSKRKSLLDKVELLNLQSQQTETQLASLQNEVAAINKSMTFINNQLQANMALSAKGFSGKNQVWENQRVLSEKKERLNGQQAYIEAARVNVTSLRSQISALENEYTQEGADQLAETRREIAETEQTMRPIREQNARTTITAPVAGQVINLQVSTTGGVIASGQPLLEIVPVVDKLIVELKVNTLDIDSVHVDQDAKVQLLSYSRLNTPLLQGKVVYISGDVLENPIKPGEYYYLCHLQVSQASLQQLPDYVKLYPGMPVTAFIQTRSRTLSTYLLEPIADNMARNLYRNH